MVSYTRLFLLVLLGLGTPLFLLFQGSMNLGQQIAAGTVLLAFLALFVFSGRKPLPSTLKSPVVEIEEEDEEPESAPVPEVVEAEEQEIRRSRRRVATPVSTPPAVSYTHLTLPTILRV